MANLPGFFLMVDHTASVLVDADASYNVSNLTFAVVYHQEESEWAHRWTTWGIDADSMLFYQPASGSDVLVVANSGYLYALDDDYHTDDGKGIPIVIETGPSPEKTQEVQAHTFKRIASIMWELATPPPETGYAVTVTLTDTSNPANTATRTVQQYTTQMDIDLALRCRQCYVKLSATVGRDFNVISMGMRFQQDEFRKTARG